MGFPGLIFTPLKILFNLNCFTIFGIKSNFPADTAPEVMTKSDLDFIFFKISFLKTMLSLSLKIFLTIKFIGKFFVNESK